MCCIEKQPEKLDNKYIIFKERCGLRYCGKVKYIGVLNRRQYIYTFKAYLDKVPLDFLNDTPTYRYIENMKQALNNKTVKVIRKFSQFLVLAPQTFIQMWIQPLRSQWLVNSYDHTLASHSYQFINTPLGDPRVAAAYLGGKQCFVQQVPENGTQCASFAVISKKMIYKILKPNDDKIWIRISETTPTTETEPIFMVYYEEIYQFCVSFSIYIYVHNVN